MEFRSHTLANGLQVVAECNSEALSIALGYFVKAGSRDEVPEVAGVSHFLEHMAFKGTPRRSAEDVNREFDELGAHYNAFTSEENTVYYASLLPEYQNESVNLLSDIMRPSLRADDFEMEKKVIVEEIQMYLDQPPYGMDDRIKQLCFGAHPIASSVIGSVDTVTALTPEQMLAYHQHRYGADNLFLAAAGNIDFDELVASAERYTAQWSSTSPTRDTPQAETNVGSILKSDESVHQQYLLMLRDGPSFDDPLRFAAKLLAAIVGDDSGSRFYWDLIDTGDAESASLGHYEYQGLGMFYTWLSCPPEMAAKNLDSIRAMYAALENDGITANELQLAKNKAKSRVVLGSERPRSRMFNLGGNWMNRGEHREVSQDLADLDAVTVDDVMAVVQQYPLTQHAVATVGPLEQLEGLEAE